MSLLLTNLDGRVTLKGLLGAGGMGEVHRAWDAGLERPVAVKFVRSADPKEADRLLLEARLQARVEHPNVVRVHDTGTLEGRPCILLQLVEGQTFADLKVGTPWQEKVSLAVQAARGLGAAHRMGLVHRDVKPANILVEATKEGLQALLSDFGLARDEEGGLTRSGLMMGTVDFMAPEQVTGATPVDFRADIYGLGATLYAVLAGRPPFRNTPNPKSDASASQGLPGATTEEEMHPGDLLRRVLEHNPRSLAAEVPGLPRDLAIVVAKAMEKEPTRRYVTAEALADDLERVLRGEAIQARPMSWLERGGRWIRRNPIPARALFSGVLAMISAGGFIGWNSRRSALEALDAAQLGGEAKAFELRLRMAYLAPAHDLRSVHAELRAGLVRLAGRRGAASSASDYARGRVYLVLNELDEARTALGLAQEKGFKGPDMEAALGIVYGRIYQRDLMALESLQDPAFRASRIAELQHRLRAPALAHLGAAGGDPLLQAEAALLNGHYEETRRLALEARARDPERMEATVLAARVWYREGRDAYNNRELPRAETCAMQGASVAQGLLEDLRSDPAVPILLGGFMDLRASVALDRGENPRQHIAAGMSFVDRALALDPDSRDAWTLKVQLLANRTKSSVQADQDGLVQAKTLLEATRKLVAQDSKSAKAQQLLSYALYAVGHEADSRGEDPAPFHLEGFKAGMEADRLEPWNAMGIYRALLNAVQHIEAQIKRGKDSSELVLAAEAAAKRLEKMEGRGGLNPRALLGTLANLRQVMGRVAWLQGRDPDPYMAEAMGSYLQLRAVEPDHVEHLAYLCFFAQQRMESLGSAGRDVEALFRAILPVADEAIRRTPEQPMLKAYRAAIYVFSLAGQVQGRPMALDPERRKAAHRAVDEAIVATRHPALIETRGLLWLVEAEAGIHASADKAVKDLETVVRANIAASSTNVSMIRALRIRRGPGDLTRAMALLEKQRQAEPTDPDLMLFQAVLLKDLGRDAEAGVWRQRALGVQPLLVGHPVYISAFGAVGPVLASGQMVR
jgi:serine/threonine-protein kinase